MKKSIPVVWSVLIIILAILLESPISVKPTDTKGFSALNVQKHMNEMASEFHFMGTKANRKVRDYILREFEKLDIETEVYTGFCEKSFGGYTRIAKTENIIATLKGTNNSKAVVFAGHYDSVLNAPGAADDVHSVACMIETAKLLKKDKPKNDIIFLITDGEEMGLLGAKAFVENKPTDHIGVLFNYEARGNSGAGIFFEWSEGNSWLVKEMRKACNRPVSNSMAYEIYNKLPNDTDFTYFKAAGIKGINHAFIDGFSYYHNPADTPENINLNSVQHTGENMWRLARHFGNTPLNEIPAESNASFFNFLGLLVIYPSGLDLFILLLTIFMIGFTLYQGFKNTLSFKRVFVSFLAILFCLSVIVVIALGTSALLFNLYPQYDHFYTGQYYNHKWYILFSCGLALVFSWVFFIAFKKDKSLGPIQAASLIFLGLISILVYFSLPTASYLLTLPTLSLALAHYTAQYPLKNSPGKKDVVSYILSIIPLGIWGPVIITLFLAFSIKLLFVPALVTLFLVMGTLILFPESWEGKIYPSLGGLLILTGLLGAHFNAAPSTKKPLPSSLYYLYNTSGGQAYWVTDDPGVNDGNRSAMKDAALRELQFPNKSWKLSSRALVKPSVSIPTIKLDSVSSKATIRSTNEVFKTRVYISGTDNIKSMALNGYEAINENDEKRIFFADLLGFTQDSLIIQCIKKDPAKKDTLWINSMIRSMPKKHPAPENYIRKDNFSAIIQEVVI